MRHGTPVTRLSIVRRGSDRNLPYRAVGIPASALLQLPIPWGIPMQAKEAIMAENVPVVTTFTPLRRNRVRCNQTGAVLRKAQITAYRNQREGTGRIGILPMIKPPRWEVRGTYSVHLRETQFKCPVCSTWERRSRKFRGTTRCSNCDTLLLVKSDRLRE